MRCCIPLSSSFRLFCSFLSTPDTLRLYIRLSSNFRGLSSTISWQMFIVYSRHLLAIGFSKINPQYPKVTNKPPGAHNNCRFREAEKLSCFDIPAGAQEVSEIRRITDFDEQKSCFGELQLIFAIAQSDFQKKQNLHF